MTTATRTDIEVLGSCGLILINAAGFDDVQTNVGEVISKINTRRKPIVSTHEKYVDDLTLLELIDIKRQIVHDTDADPTRPVPYHLRTGHFLPAGNSLVHEQLWRLERYAEEHQMRINSSKTKLMLFSESRTVDIQPEFYVNGEEIQMVDKFKLLGVVLTSDLKWKENTTYIVTRCYSILWMIRRLKSLNCPQEQLIDTFIKQVRSIMEMACPAWHPTLTKADSSILERVQKSALNIILGSGYTSYESAPDILELDTDTLEERRDELCLNFARKSAEHPIHSKWFLKTKGEQHTRNHNIYQPVWARTGRFGKSPIPHMTNIPNEHCRKKK